MTDSRLGRDVNLLKIKGADVTLNAAVRICVVLLFPPQARMLVPSQSEGQSGRRAFASFGMKPLPNFAAEFLTGEHPGSRVRSLEVPMSNPLHILKPEGYDCPITETYLRAEKLRHFAQDCSWAFDHVYFGGEGVAQDRRKLQANGITHVVNCARLEVQTRFNELQYKELYLQDSGMEDILAVLYDVFDFIEQAKQHNGNVFIHCSQGVSRSAALVIAYVMWRKRQSFEVTKDQMKVQRGVVDPNINFCSQLLSWSTHFASTNEKFLRVYRIDSQSEPQPDYLVPKLIYHPKNCSARHMSHVLDSHWVYVVHGWKGMFIWIGRHHNPEHLVCARKVSRQLRRYEGALEAIELHQGRESVEFYDLFKQTHSVALTTQDKIDMAQDEEVGRWDAKVTSCRQATSQS